MVDLIFTDELFLPLFVPLVHPYFTLRQGDAQAALLFVLEGDIDSHFCVGLLAEAFLRAIGAVIPPRSPLIDEAIVDIGFLRLHVMCRSELHLLGLVVPNVCPSLQRVKLVLKEIRLGELGCSCFRCHVGSHRLVERHGLVLDDVHVPGHELQARVVKRGPRVVRQRHPPGYVEGTPLVVHEGHVGAGP